MEDQKKYIHLNELFTVWHNVTNYLFIYLFCLVLVVCAIAGESSSCNVMHHIPSVCVRERGRERIVFFLL